MKKRSLALQWIGVLTLAASSLAQSPEQLASTETLILENGLYLIQNGLEESLALDISVNLGVEDEVWFTVDGAIIEPGESHYGVIPDIELDRIRATKAVIPSLQWWEESFASQGPPHEFLLDVPFELSGDWDASVFDEGAILASGQDPHSLLLREDDGSEFILDVPQRASLVTDGDAWSLRYDTRFIAQYLPEGCGAFVPGCPEPDAVGDYLKNPSSQCHLIATYNAVVDAGYSVTLEEYKLFRASAIELKWFVKRQGSSGSRKLLKWAASLFKLTGKTMEATSAFQPTDAEWDALTEGL